MANRNNELNTVLAPRSLALVGVSAHPNNISSRPLKYLRKFGFKGRIFLVNPKAPLIDGVQSYRSLLEVPEPIDLVVSLVPAAHVIDVARDAVQIGAVGLVVFASGFAEIGEQGRKAQFELGRLASTTKLRILGPNSQGFVYAPHGTWATFTTAADRQMGMNGLGGAYVGQSGAIGGVILDRISEIGLPVVAWISTGNEVDLNAIEIATILLENDRIAYIILYIEYIADESKFRDFAARAAAVDKPIVLLHSGRSEAGRRATSSHTGAMLGTDLTLRAIAKRFDIPLTEDIAQTVFVSALLANRQRPAGRRLGVVTSSGGAGGLFADLATRHGFELPILTRDTQRSLKPFIPSFGSVSNPVDVTAQLFANNDTTIAVVCETLAKDVNLDAIVIILTNITGAEAVSVADDIIGFIKVARKPAYVVWPLSRQATADARGRFGRAELPVFDSTTALIDSLDAILPKAGAMQMPPIAERSIEEQRGANDDFDASAIASGLASVQSDGGAQLLDSLKVPHPRSYIMHSEKEIQRCDLGMAPAYVLKVLAPSLRHKSDIGAVAMNVTQGEVLNAYRHLMNVASSNNVRDVRGIQIQEMVETGVEVLISVVRESRNSPTVACVGIGGIATELQRELEFCLTPCTFNDILSLLSKLTLWPILNGYRGGPKYDVSGIATCLLNLIDGMALISEPISTIEINPLIVHTTGRGVSAVDLLIT